MKLQIKDRLLFDGAFGSYYHKLTGDLGPCELANLQAPDVVERIHREYLQAGAQAIKSNTFAANTSALQLPFEEIEKIIRAGYALAEKAAGTEAAVFADIGPISSEDGQKTREELVKIADVFLALGAQNFLFETFAGFDELVPTLENIKRKCPDAFVIVSFAASRDGYTKDGNYYQALIEQAEKSPQIDACGLNCVCGPAHICALNRVLKRGTKMRAVMPNAGYPTAIGGRMIYDDNADYFSERLLEIAGDGVKILGGCCGTTPEHIAKVYQRLKNGQESETRNRVVTPGGQKKRKTNPFLEKIQQGKPVIAVEISPPSNVEIDRMLAGAKAVKEAGADLITVPDSPLSRARANSVMCAARLHRETGLPVMPHLACRDRNMVGLKSILLAGKMEGIDLVLAITGDPMEHKTDTCDRGVFSLHSINLLSYIHSLNEEVFQEDEYTTAGALNVNVPNFEAELRRAVKKQENGASLFLTQPVFDACAAENLKRAKAVLKAKILAGIMPLASYKNAVFVNNEIAGISVPEEIIQALYGLDREQATAVSVKYSSEIAKRIRPFCDGYYLVTPLGRYDLCCKLIQAIKE